MDEGQWCQHVPPGDSRSGPNYHGVDQLSWMSRDLYRGPACLTCCPGLIGPGSDGLCVDQLYWTTQARVTVPAGKTNTPG